MQSDDRQVTKNEFSIHLIPETLEITNLSNIKIGDPLNIEIEQTTFTTVETIKKVLIQKRLKTK
ncbi:MAG: hypothetical protein CM15mP127_04420 [Gammaproteobacteria bacterium]|nr:MAG: hypothetical protein CM15mP127_04420 [Gammaproteobacteria bacterium]